MFKSFSRTKLYSTIPSPGIVLYCWLVPHCTITLYSIVPLPCTEWYHYLVQYCTITLYRVVPLPCTVLYHYHVPCGTVTSFRRQYKEVLEQIANSEIAFSLGLGILFKGNELFPHYFLVISTLSFHLKNRSFGKRMFELADVKIILPGNILGKERAYAIKGFVKTNGKAIFSEPPHYNLKIN